MHEAIPAASRRIGHPKGQPATNKGKKYPAEPLTEAEANRLLAASSSTSATGIRNRALIAVMWRGGLRIAEALALRPVDVDQAAGTLRVLHGKGDKSRTSGIDPGAMALVQRWIDTRKRADIRNGHLFCTLDGRQLSDVYVRNMLKRLAEKAGIEKRVAPHQLRHSFAVSLVQEGAPVWEVQQLLGHASLDGTAHYLAGLQPGAALERVRARRWEEPA